MSDKTTQRVRSPNYPNYSLKECIGFLEKLDKKYGTKEVHIDDAVEQMGHSHTSSTAARVIASMLSFGLLNSRGSKNNRYVWLSPLSQEILLAENDADEKLKLLQKAALNDAAITSIWEKYGNNIPGETTLRKVLEYEMSFSKGGANRFSSVLTDTYEFAKLNQLDSEESDEEENDKEEGLNNQFDSPQNPQSSLDVIGPKTNNDVQLRKANLLLAGQNREIIIYAPVDLTEEEFDLIGDWLRLQKYGLVAKKALNDEKDEP